jgi:tRNA A-37 threonylcarbamoyl transferase component Bud32
MHDIIKGMLFLHGSELKYHGNLTSSNCVVDSRFTLKLADFGLTMLHQSTQLDSEEKHYKSNFLQLTKFLNKIILANNKKIRTIVESA